MKKVTVKILSILLIAATLIGCLPVLTFAASAPDFWASPIAEGAETERPISAVKWWYDDDDQKYYLFMPSDGDLSNMQVWFEGDTCSIDQTFVWEGATTALLTAGDHTINIDGVNYPACVMKSANIGSMYITTESGNLNYIHAKKGNKESGMIKYVNEEGETIYDGELDEIKGRGNATWSRPKKPYQFKLPKKQDLIGAGKHKTWILLANYLERTMVRNKVIYDLANSAGLTNSCESTFVDLYCNGEYRGTYQLCEKVQIGDSRIEINDLEGETEDANELDLDEYPRFGSNTAVAGTSKGYIIPNDPEDITGGYLLELEDHKDRYASEVSGFVTTRGQPVTIKAPEYASEAQVAYISNFFQEFEDALYAEDGINPTTGKHYSEYFDITSLARKYIIEELTKNIDIDKTSQYFYKPSDLESTVGFCGPVWDYDNSMGNYIAGSASGGGSATDPTGIYGGNGNYISKLYGQEDFMNVLRAEWNVNYVPLLQEVVGLADSTEETMVTPLDELYEMLAPSAAMNFTFWENIKAVDGANYNYTGSTFQEHYNFLKDFLTKRLEYLTSAWTLDDIEVEIPEAAESITGEIPNILDYDGNSSIYQVNSEEGLQKLADLVTSGKSLKNITILQTQDITLTKEFTPGGQVNTDLTTAITPKNNQQVFRGILNGQGYKIYNLNINKPQQDGVGLFTVAYRATIIDVHIASGNIVGYNRVGGICGYGDASTFIRCSNNATITANAGGVDGSAGIAGVARDAASPAAVASFESCYNTGSITGGVVAGICGWAQASATFNNCYNIGNLTALTSASGSCRPIARSRYTTNFLTTCHYLLGQGVEEHGANPFAKAALTNGSLLSKLNATSKVWVAGTDHPVHAKNISVTRNYLIGGETFRTETVFVAEESEVKLISGNAAFVDTVKLNGNETTAETAVLTEAAVIDIYLSAVGAPITEYTAAGTYYVSTAAELQHFLDLTKENDLAGSTVYVISDINASAITTGGTFAGSLNGQFSKLSGLTAPLFTAVAESGNIRKLIVADAQFTGNGVIAETNAGTLAYIVAKNLAIRGNAGIVGSNSGMILACSTDGFIIAEAVAGGITTSNSGTIRNCINNARIIVPGGIAGSMAAASTGSISNCVNTGMLNGTTNYAIANGTATDSYHWDWCVGLGNEENAVLSAEIADAEFMTALTGGYWNVGQTVPTIQQYTYELGDVDADGTITLDDAVLAVRYLGGVTPPKGHAPGAADLGGGGVSAADITLMLRYLLGIYTI